MQYKIFGCKVNKYYTDEWLNSSYLRDKSGIFIASCVVTDNAKRKWVKFIKDLFKNKDIDTNLWEKVYVSGCGAFIKWEAQDDFFDIYPDLAEYRGCIEILWEKPKELKKEIIDSKEVKNTNMNRDLLHKISTKFKNVPQIYTKKFLLVQWGCDSFCTFCLTVKKRGKHYFRDKEDIVDEITEFEVWGGKEVVLTGVNLSAWGLKETNDIGNSRFAELLEYILEKTEIPRVRISSMGPEFIDDKCLEIFKNTRIYPHFHYSVQSGSSKTLKAMHRHYDGPYMRSLLEKTKNITRVDGVEISIGADLIVWFPGETDEDFADSCDLIKDGLITKIHAFPFSAHTLGESVPAGKFPNQLSDAVKKERMWALEEASEITRDAFIDRNIEKEFLVLVEGYKVDQATGKTKWKWWTQNYIEADQNNFEILEGELKRNQIVRGVLKR